MSTFILDSNLQTWTSAQELLNKPEFRKATPNMALGTSVLEPLFSKWKTTALKDPSRVGLVFTTQTGELETTLDFLRVFGQEGRARPLLFQNSLHNATCGFLAIQFCIQGPAISNCTKFFAEEQALEMAQLLIDDDQCDTCFVVSVDIWPKISGFDSITAELTNGASAILLARESFGSKLKLEKIELHPTQSSTENTRWSSRPINENSIFNLCKFIADKNSGELKTTHSEHGFSLISLSSNQ